MILFSKGLKMINIERFKQQFHDRYENCRKISVSFCSSQILEKDEKTNIETTIMSLNGLRKVINYKFDQKIKEYEDKLKNV